MHKKKPRKFKPHRKALRPAPPPGQEVQREKLYGEFDDPAGGIYFCFRYPRHNPFAKHHVARYVHIGRLKKEQVEHIHGIELRIGRPLAPAEITYHAMLPPLKVLDHKIAEAIEEWLKGNMVDEVDHRCFEIPVADVKKYPWSATHPHLVRQLGMYHSTDWAFLKADLKVAPDKPQRRAEVESADVADQQESMFQT